MITLANYLSASLKFLLFFFLLFSVYSVSAQLQANFIVDKQGGCSPLNVRFTNTTTGSSAAATWAWNFGNGNTSALRDPGASYFTAQAYTVSLTVTDGAFTSTKTMIITVYKNPVVDFSVTPTLGCVPLNVNFSSIATAGDGSISNYLWDFGDGVTMQGASYNTIPHTYTFPQTPPVTLNVTNSHGCYTTVTKNNTINAVRGVTAAFTASTLQLCNAGSSITFNNSSTGSGTLSYSWNFGDGSPLSTQQSPVHMYAASGTFIAILTVSSSDGCSATLQSASINVANFVANFSMPAKICENQQVVFTNSSTASFTNTQWYLDNQLQYGNYNADLYATFTLPGQHTLKLISWYGNCSVQVTKTFTVYPAPRLNGFIAQLQGACGAPVTINFNDTCSTAVEWNWQHGYIGGVSFGNTSNVTHTYTSGSGEYVYLTVKNSDGCAASVYKYINYEKPAVNIYLTNNSPNQGCTGLTIHLAASPDSIISSYKWRFGDGSAFDTTRTPTHTYNTGGNFTVTLDYVTINGCAGTANIYNINVVDKPAFDITSSPASTVCGNSPVNFSVTSAASGWYYNWYFNDTAYYNSYSSSIIHRFRYDTIYTVKMIAWNSGCRDTIVKSNFIKVLPPFPKIREYLNTCNNTRGMVRFTENSLKALQWSWDFGDGITDSYSTFRDTIRHTYAATGTYNVVLSATNGACTVKDSITTYVLLKQQPLLTTTPTSVCGSDVVNFRLAGYEVNPRPYFNDYYYISGKQYGDLSNCTAPIQQSNYYWQTSVDFTITGMEPGKNDLRIITTSNWFNCADTSNFVPLRIHGPTAGFKKELHSGCFKDAVYFTDTSRAFNNKAIVRWDWNFGDGTTQTLNSGGSTNHFFNTPGNYYVVLKVTDIDGCSHQTVSYQFNVSISGPKADFTASAYTVPVNTTVYFNNTSNYYNSYYSPILWIFSDGTTSTSGNPTFMFTQEGSFTVMLITNNTQTGCTDTARKLITVRKVNSAFSYNLSYISSNSCPPVIATFTSIPSIAVSQAWNFGDGGVAGNQQVVSHTYNTPGMYRVVHYSYDANNAVDSTEDYIEIRGPYALLKADTLFSCNTLQVKLTAEVKYASSYTWDFGDGTVIPTTDTFAVHNYPTPGIYVPSLILRDAGGCTATSSLPDRIVVDSLSASFTLSPSVICDSGQSIFSPVVSSLSANLVQAPLVYRWVTKELNNTDTSYNTSNSYFFTKVGMHTVDFQVTSPYGCKQNFRKTVTVKPGIAAFITGTNSICQGTTASFTATATPANNSLQWKWNFGNNVFSMEQNPPAQLFTIAGPQQISLIVNNGSCSDTTYHNLMVHAKPVMSITPADPFVCLGNSTLLTASGGTGYQWTSAGTLTNAVSAAATVKPAAGTFYFVKVTNAQGCHSSDSVFVKVVMPADVKVPAALFGCEGDKVQLSASGADNYKWIGNTGGLSDLNIYNPEATISNSTSFTVVGFDNYNCFSDTAVLPVRISKLPLVDAGLNQEQLLAGSSITLAPTVSGAVSWVWSPAEYLNCTTCLNPVSKPLTSILYKLTAYNIDGCTNHDYIKLSLLCKNSLVFIPNAFTPNNDNKNDRFNITGSGIKSIKSIIIYNRWGNVIFERRNIGINDYNNSWDGTYKGQSVEQGAYVYLINTECEGGDVFNFKGTVMIVR